MADNNKPVALIDDVRRDLQKMEPQFANALPAHIPAERFVRVLMTAIQNNPKLLTCRRQSLFNAAMRCAQDGLLPDGREATIVPFGDTDDDGKKQSDTASYMPMIAGIRKKARNSGELSDWYAEIVHEGDEFEFVLGDQPRLYHKPSLTGGRTRKIVAAYSIAVFKDGTISREIMTIGEIEDVRQRYSRSKRGPWSDPVAYPEMCRKTVARLHSKQLPMSSDLDDLLRRDSELYDMTGASDRAARPKRVAGNSRPALDHFAGPTDGQGQRLESDGDGVVIDNDSSSAGVEHAAGGGAPAPTSGAASGAGATSDAKKTEPKTQAAYVAYAGNWRDATDDADELARRWDAEKGLRNRCLVEPEVRDDLKALLDVKIGMLRAKAGAPA